MINNDFSAVMSSEEFRFGEVRHQDAELSRKLAMVAGLSKSSRELHNIWKQDPDTYLVTLGGAIAAYDENKVIEELLISCIARLASVVEDPENTDSALISRAVEIVNENEIAD